MTSGIQDKTQGAAPGRRVAFGWAACVAALCLVFLAAPASYAGPRVWAGGQRAQTRPAAPARQAPARPPAGRAAEPERGNNGGRAVGSPGELRPGGGNVPMVRPGVNGNPALNGADRPGHLGQWLMNHQNLSPQQQEEMLRREPGFNRLSPDQQQRVLNRLRSLDERPPEQRQRMIDRNEMFERLTPEQKVGVRGAFQSWNQMAPDRHRMVGRAFADLRQIPPDQRWAILNSARFSQEFSPEERRVLGNLLSIEPYEPR